MRRKKIRSLIKKIMILMTIMSSKGILICRMMALILLPHVLTMKGGLLKRKPIWSGTKTDPF